MSLVACPMVNPVILVLMGEEERARLLVEVRESFMEPEVRGVLMLALTAAEVWGSIEYN